MWDNPLYDQGVGLLEGAFQLDHSTSVSDLGSLFVWHDDKPLQLLKRQIADSYGVVWAFPSTTGTTALNILALLSACPTGGRLLVNRDAHISATAAMIHGGFRPSYLLPEYDAQLGLSFGPTLSAFKQALRRERVDCVFLTSPNYFGIVGELPEIVAHARELGLPVVIDAAHGPHFHFCRSLPIAAEDTGADLITQSTHKVGGALSQGSLLLIGNEKFIPALYENVNDLGFVTTSFSYPILASIELGVRQLVTEGAALWGRTIDRAKVFREAVRTIPGVTCFGNEQTWKRGFMQFDPTRVTLDVSGTGLTGFDFQQRLIEEAIYPEMGTLKHVLFLFTPGTSEADIRKLLQGVRKIAERNRARTRMTVPPPPPVPRMEMTPREAKFTGKVTVRVEESIGEVCGETVATYPPGAPIIAKGEVVTAEVVEYLRHMRECGAVLKGASDPAFRTIKVLDLTHRRRAALEQVSQF